MDNETKLIKDCIRVLGINQPYYRVDIVNEGGEVKVTFYLLGGKTVSRVIPAEAGPVDVLPVRPSPKGDDFTIIPGVGEATAGKLYTAGVKSFAMLKQAWPMWLRRQMERDLNGRTLDAIDRYVGGK